MEEKKAGTQGGKNWPWGTENWEEVFWKQIPDVVHQHFRALPVNLRADLCMFFSCRNC